MLVVAHLTDIHIHGDLDPILARADLIGAAIASHLSSAKALVILVTGDIAYSGAQEQYELALTFFRKIEERIAREFVSAVKFVLVPGNHDCDFSGDQSLRNLVLKQISEKPTTELTPQFVETCVEIQNGFFSLLAQLTGLAPEGAERIRYSDQISVGGKAVHFDCLNLSWVSQLREDRVTFPSSIIPAQKDVDGCVVTAMHHPFNWLHPSSYRDFRKRIRSHSDFIFSGHEHQWNVMETEDMESGATIQLEGSVLQESASEHSGFSIVEIDLADEKYRVFQYQWSDARYERLEPAGWSNHRSFQLASPAGAWVFTKNFDAELSDLGATLRVGGRAEVQLEDIFVFPDLEAASDGDDDSSTIHGESLIGDPENLAGFIVQGDDRSGRTTLLKHLTKKYYELGKIPLLVPSGVFARATDEEIDADLDGLCKKQYGQSLSQFLQIPKAERAILVDDLDEVPIRSEKARRQLLCRLRERCGALVLGVSDVFDATYLVGSDGGRIYEALPKFKILPFGRLNRARLISRWVTLDSDEFLDGEERIRRIDDATKYVDIVMRWKVVPPYPIYLLTLLQAQKSGSPESFKESGLGYYYQYLISDAMLDAGVSKDELTTIDQYCAQLAWVLKKLGRPYISRDELFDFNREFSREWVNLDFETVREKLLRSRVIGISGDVIEFRYSYIYYFFVAKYLADNFDDAEVQGFISAATKQLYVRSNANILVFLTHFVANPIVIDQILETLNAQMAGRPLAQFALRNESIEKMLRQLPAVVYGGGDPEANREREAERRDAISRDEQDGMVEHPAEMDVLSLGAQLTIVFKAVEILGQILKTQYSRIQRQRRERIVRDMINAPLRALEVFFEALRENPEALLAEFEAKLAESSSENQTAEGRRALAERLVGSITLEVTFGFLKRISESVGAEALSDDLRAVAQRDEDLGHLLIRLSALLDGQRPIPRVEIERIRRLGAGSLIVDRVIQVLVVYHMYMFRTNYPDIRWAQDVLDIPERVKVRAMFAQGSTKPQVQGG